MNPSGVRGTSDIRGFVQQSQTNVALQQETAAMANQGVGAGCNLPKRGV